VKGDSTGKLKCANKMNYLLFSAADTVSCQHRLEACTVDGGSGNVLKIEQAILNYVH
jgi:hypothetical protein